MTDKQFSAVSLAIQDLQRELSSFHWKCSNILATNSVENGETSNINQVYVTVKLEDLEELSKLVDSARHAFWTEDPAANSPAHKELTSLRLKLERMLK